MRLLERFFRDGEPRIDWAGQILGQDALRARVRGAARWMREQGLDVGDRVGLHLPHGVAAPVCLFACWHAGLVAVPLDLHHPPDRLASLMRRSGCKLLVTWGRRGAALARRVGGPVLVLDEQWSLPEGGDDEVPISADAAALILWTSGSTGEPKGVTIPRGAVDAFVAHWSERLTLGAADKVGWTAALSFDLSLLDIGVALSSGCTLVPVPESQLGFPREMRSWLEERGVTCIYTVPSLLTRLFPGDEALPPALRVVLSAGEALPSALAVSLRDRLPPAAVLGNLFGPTETNVSTAWLAPPGWRGERVPIGVPCPYVEVRLSPDGEMLVRGATVMEGYWGEPDRATWSDGWLHTGDRAQWEGESLIFLGRMDRMVKIRGYRVEPEEVEGALAALDGVSEAAVIVDRDGEEARLRGFVVAGVADPADLLDQLRARLPGWACPDSIESVQALPRTARGKVDYAALRTLEL